MATVYIFINHYSLHISCNHNGAGTVCILNILEGRIDNVEQELGAGD